MLILFHKETRKKFLSLAASLVHADDAVRTEKKRKKVATISLASNYLLMWWSSFYWMHYYFH
jgi:hypothetical protein